MSEKLLITKELCNSCLFCYDRNNSQKTSCGFSLITGRSRVFEKGVKKIEDGYCSEYVKLNSEIGWDEQVRRVKKFKAENEIIFRR